MNPTEFVALAEGSDCSSDEELNTVSKHLAIIKVSHKQLLKRRLRKRHLPVIKSLI